MNAKKFILPGCVAACVFAAATATAMGGHGGSMGGGHGGSMGGMGMRGGGMGGMGMRGGGFMPHSTGGMPMHRGPMMNSPSGMRHFGDRNFNRNDRFNRFNRFNDGRFARFDRFNRFNRFNNFNQVVFIGDFGFPWWWGWGPWWGGGWGWGSPYGYYGGYGNGNYGSGYGYSDSSGSRVAELQNRLASAGYYHGAVDGIMGPATRRAIRAYERDHGYAG